MSRLTHWCLPIALVTFILVISDAKRANAASGSTLPTCIARKLHGAGEACRLIVGGQTGIRVTATLARVFGKAESRAASAGIDCRTGRTAEDIDAELNAGSAFVSYYRLRRFNYQLIECRRLPIRDVAKVSARVCAEVLTAEARFARDPDAIHLAQLAQTRGKARERIEASLALYAPLGCSPDGLADALFGAVDSLVEHLTAP